MDALHNDNRTQTALEATHAATAARVRRFLASRYPLRACLPSSPDFPAPERMWREVWEVEAGGGNALHRLLLAVPTTFPDVFPSIYLPVDVAEHVGTIPHLNRDRFLCTFDANIASPNSDQPEAVAVEVLNRAVQILEAGQDRTNAEDFADEITAYWEDIDDEEPAAALSLLLPGSPHRKVAMLRLKPTWRRFGRLFAETKEEGLEWLRAVSYKGQIHLAPALHINLNKFGLPPFPATNRELYMRLQECAPEALQRLIVFLKSSPRPAWVLASIPADTAQTYIAWGHPPFTRRRFTGTGYQDRAEPIPGFRPSHQPAEIELLQLNARARLRKATVSVVHLERLLRRTAGATLGILPTPVSVIGCGSVGGFMAEGIARSGYTRELRLIDKEVMMPENTVRHPCGMTDVRKPKAEAVASLIHTHFPHVRCETYNADVLDLLRRNAHALSPSALTIIAIGNTPVERRLNQLCFSPDTGLTFPICFVWVEPHLYGGHALYLADPEHGCLECLFDACLRFRHRVVQRPELYTAREAGCQSSFVPYSGTDLVQFTALSTRFVLECLKTDKPSSLLSWTGDLNQARAVGVALTDEYASQSPFVTVIRTLSRSLSCPVCSA